MIFLNLELLKIVACHELLRLSSLLLLVILSLHTLPRSTLLNISPLSDLLHLLYVPARWPFFVLYLYNRLLLLVVTIILKC